VGANDFPDHVLRRRLRRPRRHRRLGRAGARRLRRRRLRRLGPAKRRLAGRRARIARGQLRGQAGQRLLEVGVVAGKLLLLVIVVGCFGASVGFEDQGLLLAWADQRGAPPKTARSRRRKVVIFLGLRRRAVSPPRTKKAAIAAFPWKRGAGIAGPARRDGA